MNKKGFTLVELLIVIAILGLIAVIATPNILGLITNSKKDQLVADAKEMISKAKYHFKQEKYASLFMNEDGCKAITAKNMGFNKEENVDKDKYDLEASKVKICSDSNGYQYYVITKSKKADGTSGRGINRDGDYVKEENVNVNNVS